MACSDPTMRAWYQMTAGVKAIGPLLKRHGLHETNQRMEVLMLRLKPIIIALRDVDKIAETGCCCGQLRGCRTNRELCEACEVRAGSGGCL